jgi:hypothetical protein
MASLADRFLDMATNVSETQFLATSNGYTNVLSRGKYALNCLLDTDFERAQHLGHTWRHTITSEFLDRGQFHSGSGFRTQSEGGNTAFKLTQEFAFRYNYVHWDEPEIEADLSPGMGDDYVKAKFGDTLEGKYQELYQMESNAIEDALWAPADQAAMFTSLTKPVSIPTLITEEAYFPLQADGSATTTVYNATDVTAPGYDNGRFTYGALGGNTTTGDDLIGRLQDAWIQSDYEPIPLGAQYGPGHMPPNIIFCSFTGLRAIRAALRNGQTQWGKMELVPGMGNAFTLGDGMMIKPISALGSALLYKNASSPTALVNELNGTSGAISGPRFYGVNLRDMKLRVETGHWMNMQKPTVLTAAGRPYEVHQGLKSKLQLTCDSRRTSWILSPSIDISISA